MRKIWATREALASLDIPPIISIVFCRGYAILRGWCTWRRLPHQGLVAEVDPLEDILAGRSVATGCRRQKARIVPPGAR